MGRRIQNYEEEFGGPSLPFALAPNFQKDTLNVLFPSREDNWAKEAPDTPMPFSLEELQAASERIRCGTAPGPDRIHPEL